ncbi:D-alanyl-D-alanine carboxypeptidase [Aliishimia ponticola]|uniref:D-alanyl-D-alanine carboxypeptidase n=1 Tax=Aliishimia ponticola TaxID=2499833 RepID=A0A4S4NBQ8_9RHOB|nr:D-alanyl-D-alanine carboxypeptidase family protein [Aliishimia ponticola]THH36856.1 D-alanyl-D-alanine carboxypeptidase [Aliishimia ponticola]
MCLIVPLSARAAPYAAMVMDARTGEVLHSRNADTRLHPASLTKMMTLYIAFEAVERGEISLDKKIRISKNAAAEPPSKLGLRAGQKIALRYLIRAAAVKSANDAATAIGEAISGSEAAFARRMNRTAKALGMTRTTFKNAHGLTEAGHQSTARDMTILGRHLLYDFPEYYNLFSRTSTDAGIKTVANTNRRLLASYRGADGIKTGYTRAAGFNLVASAERGNERVIATVFGGKSSTSRNARVAELLDMGFRRSPSSAPVRKPSPPVYAGAATQGGAGKTIRVSGAVKKSLRPMIRPRSEPVLVASAAPKPAPEPTYEDTVNPDDIAQALAEAQIETARNEVNVGADTPTEQAVALLDASARPALRPAALLATPAPKQIPTQEVVTRASTSGGRHWGVNVGRYPSRFKAETVLLKTALTEMATLDGSLRKVVRNSRGFDANFLGLTRDSAELACRRLQARNISCTTIGPG